MVHGLETIQRLNEEASVKKVTKIVTVSEESDGNDAIYRNGKWVHDAPIVYLADLANACEGFNPIELTHVEVDFNSGDKEWQWPEDYSDLEKFITG